jgi:hypothetical protein
MKSAQTSTIVVSGLLIFWLIAGLRIDRSLAVVRPIVHGQGVGNAQADPFERARSVSCALGTMKGTHGYSYSGTVLGSTITAAGLISFDGEGKLSYTYDVNVGGTPFQSALTGLTGTYTVNADCTGSATLNLRMPGLTSNGKFVIVNGGQETFFTGIDQGVAITGITKKL